MIYFGYCYEYTRATSDWFCPRVTYIYAVYIIEHYNEFSTEQKLFLNQKYNKDFKIVISVAQALRCNFCQKIDRDYPACDEIQEKECSRGFDKCIKINLRHPACELTIFFSSDVETDKNRIVPYLSSIACVNWDFVASNDGVQWFIVSII